MKTRKEEILMFLLNITNADISLILNVAFWCIIGTIAIFALVGAIKGFWKSVVGAVVQLILLVVVMFVTPGVANLIGNIDVSGFTSSSSATIGNVEIQITSIREMICQWLTASGYVSPVNGQSIYEAAMGLTNIVLSLAVFVVLAIFVFFFGWLISTLIYHTIFKWFIPKKIRMKHKMRWLGALSGAVMGFFSVFLLMTPFSYLGNTVKQNEAAIKALKGTIDDNMDQILDYATLYGESAFGSDWMYSMSSFVVNQATSSDYLGGKANFSDITSLLAGLSKGFSKGLNSNNNSPLDFTVIVGDRAAVDGILETLIGNNIIVKVMPSLLKAAVTYVKTPESIDLTKLDFEGVDFSTEFTTIQGIYDNLYDAGFITSMLSGDLSVDSSKQNYYIEALEKLASDPLVNKNLSVLMSESASNIKNLTGYEILKLDQEVYKQTTDNGKTGIDWKKEIVTLGNAVFKLSDALGISLNEDGFKNLNTKLLDAFKDENKFNKVREILVGVTTASGEKQDGLLDTFLLDENIFNITEGINCLFSYYPVLKTYMDKDMVVENFSSATHQQIKNELTAIVDMCPDVMDLYDIGYNADTKVFTFDLSNAETLNITKDLLTQFNKLNLLKDLIPDVIYKSFPTIIKNAFGSNELFGLNAYSFNFNDVSTIIDDVKMFLDIVPTINNIIQATKDQTTLTGFVSAIDTDDLSKVLTTFIDSKMLNPNRIENGKIVKNTNINTLISSMMKQFNLGSFGFEISDDLSNVNWKSVDSSGKTIYPEVDNIIKIFNDIKGNIDAFGDDGSFDLNKLNGDDISGLLNDFMNSDLLGGSINGILNKQVKPILDGLSIEVEFNKSKKEWQKKDSNNCSPIDYVGQLFDLVKPIMNKNNIDYTQLSPIYLNCLMTTLIDTGLLGDNYGETLASFLGGVLNDSFKASDKLGYDAKIICMSPGIDGKTFKWSNTVEKKTGFSLYSDSSMEGNVEFTTDFFYTNDGEIYDLFNAFNSISSYSNELASNTYSKEMISVVLKSSHNSVILSRMIPVIIKNAMKGISSESTGEYINLDLLNFDAFIDLPSKPTDAALVDSSVTYFEDEVDRIASLYEYCDKGVLNDLIDNVQNLKLNSAIEGYTDRARKDILKEIMHDVNTMTVCTKIASGYDISFRANLYTAICKKAETTITVSGTNLTLSISELCFFDYDNITSYFTASQERRDSAMLLMSQRIYYMDSQSNSNDLFSNDEDTVIDFLVNQQDYIDNKNIEKLSSIEETNLFRGAGNTIMNLLALA